MRPDAGSLVLDTRALDVDGSRQGCEDLLRYRFEVGEVAPILGAPFGSSCARHYARAVFYSTRPEASALQWLTPPSTAGGKLPFLSAVPGDPCTELDPRSGHAGSPATYRLPSGSLPNSQRSGASNGPRRAPER